MASDGLQIKLNGAAGLDRALIKLGTSSGVRVINQSLTKAAAVVRKQVKAATPVAEKDTKGFSLDSRNTTRGQLKRSVKSGLRRKSNPNPNVFVAGVWFQDSKGGAKQSADGFYAQWVINRHSQNAFGYAGGDSFLSKAVRKAKGSFNSIMTEQLGLKITIEGQKEINKLG